jgi:hypothetical protein
MQGAISSKYYSFSLYQKQYINIIKHDNSDSIKILTAVVDDDNPMLNCVYIHSDHKEWS